MGKLPAIEISAEMIWASVHEHGMQLELWCNAAGSRKHLASFVAEDQTERLLIELVVAGHLVQLPLAELESAIAAAKEGVHSENWYDRHQVSDHDA